MNEFKRGDMYWISSGPYDNDFLTRKLEKPRPAIIISNDDQNKYSGNAEIIFLTTSPKKDRPTHCTIRSCKSLSTALCEDICTINVDQIEGYIGTITEQEMAMVENCVLISLGIASVDHPHKIESGCDRGEYITLKKEAELYKEMYNSLLNRLLEK